MNHSTTPNGETFNELLPAPTGMIRSAPFGKFAPMENEITPFPAPLPPAVTVANALGTTVFPVLASTATVSHAQSEGPWTVTP